MKNPLNIFSILLVTMFLVTPSIILAQEEDEGGLEIIFDEENKDEIIDPEFIVEGELGQECPDIPISMWCDDCDIEEHGERCLCPGKIDEDRCPVWDCDSCEEIGIVDDDFDDERVCCNEPGPADRPTYRWRDKEECESPEGAEFGVAIVDDDFCKKEVKSKFEDDPNYMCEDMNADDCEAADDCESIWGGPSFCEGDTCTTDETWEGCRYKGDEFFEEYEDEKLKQKAGTTPGSAFYFIDKFFDRFSDELEVKEERIAEIKEMVEAGDLESAKIALKEYMELAEELEKEIDPERKEDAKRSAAAIRATMKDIRDQLPPGERGKFVSEIMRKEHSIATSAEISSKIKELCIQLAELDPMEYSKMCKAEDDAPKWQKELHGKLTKEQEETAREFVDIMKQCFKTSGQDCACEEIPFYDFSIACSKAAPLATACDIDGDEIACDELENLDMPDLPEWLEPIWEVLEESLMEAQFDMHMPKECVEAGVTSPKECGKVMIKTHAPLECRSALLESGCDSERECRTICDKIMFELHAPEECVGAGITDPDKCGKLMMPPECLEKNLGPRECQKFMDNFRGPGGPRMGGPGFEGPGFGGPDCGRIEDPMERLDCYDNKGNQMGEHYGTDERFEGEGEITWQCKENRIHWPPDCEKFMREEWPEQERMRMEEGDKRRFEEGDWRIKEKECAASCDLVNGWWDFRDGECVCYATEGTGPRPGEWGSDDYEGGPACDDCVSQCPDASRTGCGPNGCECYYDGDEYNEPQYGPGEGPGEPGDYQGEPPTGSEPQIEFPSPVDEGSGEGDTEPEPEEVVPEPEPEPEPSGDDGGEEITGNAFLDYYFS